MSAKKTPVKKVPVKAAAKKTTVKKTPAKAKTIVRKPKTKPIQDEAMPIGGADIQASDIVNNLFHVFRKAHMDSILINSTLQGALPGNADLTPMQRRRLFGVQARKLGFIVKALEIATVRPQFVPPNLSMQNMTTLQGNFEEARVLLATVDQTRRLIDDNMLLTSDALYRGALGIYGMLRAMAALRVPGAQDLFDILRRFFIFRRRPGETEPTEAELNRDFNRLVHGKADGEMVIKNESPRMTGGVHEVADNVRKRGKRGAEIVVRE